MRAINLLPRDARPVSASGTRSGSAYVVLAGLCVTLLAVLAVVIYANKAHSHESAAARLSAQASETEARAAVLAPFGNFRDVKNARIDSVRSLAFGRLDWERLTREVSYVLPEGTWLTGVAGTTNAAAAAVPGAAPAAAGTPTGPTATLTGCAKRQPLVAKTLVRLRRLNGATDVRLDESGRDKLFGKAGKSRGGSGENEQCGGFMKFVVTVELESAADTPAGHDGVPSNLGGGA